MTNPLSQVPRELAERLIAETDNFGDCSHDAAIARAEAVIREAMQKLLDRADELRDELNCACLYCVVTALRKELAASSLTEQETNGVR